MFLMLSALLGIFLGAFANYAAAAWAWEPKRNHPWCASDVSRPFWYRIPIIGWFGMKNESSRFGRRFWIRPLLVELGMGAFAVWFFQGQVLQTASLLLMNEIPVTPSTLWTLVARFVFQMIFAGLMLAASLIDFDEKTIPDQITVLGTIFALVISMIFPLTIGNYSDGTSLAIFQVTQLLDFPDAPLVTGDDFFNPLTASSPFPVLGVFKTEFSGKFGLVSALLCWWGWCFAMLDRHWRMNWGWRWAWRIFWERLARSTSTRHWCRLANWGTFLIVLFWAAGWPQWLSLWSSLLGMGIAGGFMWLIRIAGKFAMNREAMGFGDVTLMAMFGAFLGWQPCLILFFIAPFAGLVLALLFMILFRDPEIPFGPFLCAAALITLLNWPTLWALTLPFFQLGSLLFTLGLGLLLLMVILLALIQGIKKFLGIDY